jgi:hypothetical protein
LVTRVERHRLFDDLQDTSHPRVGRDQALELCLDVLEDIAAEERVAVRVENILTQ